MELSVNSWWEFSGRKFLPEKIQDNLGQFNPSYSKFKIGARLSSRLGPSLSFIETRIISVIFSFTKFNFFYSRDLIGQQTFKAKNILPSEEEKILKLFFSILEKTKTFKNFEKLELEISEEAAVNLAKGKNAFYHFIAFLCILHAFNLEIKSYAT